MRKQDLPKRFHFSNSRRIDNIVLDVAENYFVAKYASSSGSVSSRRRSSGSSSHRPSSSSSSSVCCFCGCCREQ